MSTDGASFFPVGIALGGKRSTFDLQNVGISDVQYVLLTDLAPPGSNENGFPLDAVQALNQRRVNRPVLNASGNVGIVIAANSTNVTLLRLLVTNATDAVLVEGNQAQILKNIVERSINGIVVYGNSNMLDTNRAERNENGFVIAGDQNTLRNNIAGQKGNNANQNYGILVTGDFNRLVGNRAEGNGADGIHVTGHGNGLSDPIELENNIASYNQDNGIEVNGANHQIRNNRADNNGSLGFAIGPGNIDEGGNKLDGSSINL